MRNVSRFFLVSGLISLALTGCQSIPTRAPAPPAHPEMVSSAPLEIADSCEVQGAVLVEYTVLQSGQTANIDIGSGPDCAREALTAWVSSYRYVPQSTDIAARFEWILVSAKRGS